MRIEIIKISICIPSFNRPEQLERLINSIELENLKIDYEILIGEDNSPSRKQIVKIIESRICRYNNHIRLLLNEKNLGYDGNLRNLIRQAKGDFIIFMGDDDVFIKGKIRSFVEFIKTNNSLSYVLTGHHVRSNLDDSFVTHRYFRGNQYFSPSTKTAITLFRKSVFISGFTFKRELFQDFDNNYLDGTLLFQLYVLTLLVTQYPSAYYDDAIVARYKENEPLFGFSESEKSLYVPGTTTVNNSINFMMSYIKLLDYIRDHKNIDIKDSVIEDISKYSYPILSIQRNKGLIEFIKYAYKIRELGYGRTIHFYIYSLSLIILGEKSTDKLINLIKRIMGVTPSL